MGRPCLPTGAGAGPEGPVGSICGKMVCSSIGETRYAGMHGFLADYTTDRRDESLWHIHLAATTATTLLFHEEPIQRAVIPMVHAAVKTLFHRGNSGSNARVLALFQSHELLSVRILVKDGIHIRSSRVCGGLGVILNHCVCFNARNTRERCSLYEQNACTHTGSLGVFGGLGVILILLLSVWKRHGCLPWKSSHSFKPREVCKQYTQFSRRCSGWPCSLDMEQGGFWLWY